MQLTKRVLYKIAQPVDVYRVGFIKDLARDLRSTMIKNNGIGLAAPQCGIPRRIFVMYTENQHRTVVNPELLTTSADHCIINEGCLSFPNELFDISRPAVIEVKYYDESATLVTETLEGISARCFLHELDHLDGITMHKRKN